MDANLDFNELHVSVKDYFTSKPYIDSATGLTTLDLPYESCELTQTMYEPGKHQHSSAKITLPSLIQRPELRPLLQKIKEGARVEIFNFQPDVGDPVFGGNIPPDGMTQDHGMLTLDVMDSLHQGTWQHIRKIEEMNNPVSDLYDRGLKNWVNTVAQDWTHLNYEYGLSDAAKDISIREGGPYHIDSKSDGVSANDDLAWNYETNPPRIIPQPGDVYLIESLATLNLVTSNVLINDTKRYTSLYFQLYDPMSISPTSIFGQIIHKADVFTAASPTFLAYWRVFVTDYLGNTTTIPNTEPAYQIVPFDSYPATHRFGMLLKFGDSTVTVNTIMDNIVTTSVTIPWFYNVPGSVSLLPTVGPQILGNGVSIDIAWWRSRRLAPYLMKASRFVPQTTDTIYYLPNNEDNVKFFTLWAEKDFAEFRLIHHQAPTQDEIELDRVNSLGRDISATAGYAESPPSMVSPTPSVAEAGAFGIAPIFRFEEGYNLVAEPKINPKANNHANDILRMGSGTSDAQPFGEAWNINEISNPGLWTSYKPTYPIFEGITNDDRIGIPSIVQTMAGLDLKIRSDPTPSLFIQVAASLEFASLYQPGDSIYVATKSLVNNLEQSMRIMQIKKKAGVPVHEITLGRLDRDSSGLDLLAENMVISWLYEQSGSAPTVYVYPNAGASIPGSGGLSPAFSINLDKYTTGTAVVDVWVHWYMADSSINFTQAVINGSPMNPAKTVGSDSGLVDVLPLFPGPGLYTLQFKNNDSVAHTIKAAFLVIRIRV